ncbi:MAG: TetR/AcrR family transcriptional regulator [Sporichthyaceae bacterium]
MAKTGAGSRGPRTRSVDVADTLVSAASDLLARDGLNALTLRALTAAAGVAPSGIYTRFGGMDGVIDAVLVRAVADLATASSTRRIADPRERMLSGALAYRQWALDNTRVYEAMFLARPGYGSPAVTGAVQVAIEVVTAHIDYAIAAGVMAPGSVLEIAQLWWNAAHGAVSLELKGLLLISDPEYSYRTMMSILLDALATASGT